MEQVNEKLHNGHKEAEERFRLIVEAAPSGMILINQKGEIIMMNTQAERLLGYDRSELLGQQMDILVPERFRGRHMGFQTEFFHESRPRPMGAGRDLFARRKDGTEVPVEIGLTPLMTREGPMVLASVIDITERKKLEELQIEMAKSREIARLQDEFLNTASHELRTPLSVIRGGIEAVLDGLDGPLTPEQEKDLQMARRNVDRLTRLVNDVLDFQKLKAGRMHFRMKPVDINELVRDTVQDLLPAARKKGLRLDSQLADRELVALCDRDKITQVLVNLIYNAIKFTRQGRITVIVSRIDRHLRVAVSDEGRGIREEDRSKLFQSFSQLPEGETTKAGGSGLGLLISKQIIEEHHGLIDFESVYGKGSTFYFVLPLAAQKEL